MEAEVDPWINPVRSDLVGPALFNGAATWDLSSAEISLCTLKKEA